MLPPPPVKATEANAHLADLYDYLTNNVLAPDGSTTSATESYHETHQNLRDARQNVLQGQILLRALADLTSTDLPQPSSQLPRKVSRSSTPEAPTRSALPTDQQDLVYNISSYLSASVKTDSDPVQPLPPDTDELMSDEISAFRANLDTISSALSTYLTTLHTNLSETAATLFPVNTPQPTTRLRSQNSQIQPQIQSLSTTLSTATTTSSSLLTSTLPSTLSTTLTSLHSGLDNHTTTLTNTIRTLELTTHGSHARYTTARANYLTAVSRGIALKARILRLERERDIYADQAFVDALETEAESLELEERRLEKRETELLGLLEEYERAGREAVLRTGGAEVNGGSGEDVFRVLGTRYVEVEREIESVKKDIEKLQKEVWRG